VCVVFFLLNLLFILYNIYLFTFVFKIYLFILVPVMCSVVYLQIKYIMMRDHLIQLLHIGRDCRHPGRVHWSDFHDRRYSLYVNCHYSLS
jgi:hypothetical protein